MPSIFTRIINSEIPGYKIAEDEKFFAFLDIRPLAKGHTLVITKKEIDYIFDVDDNLYSGMWLFSKGVAHAIEKVIPCARIGIAVVGLEVPHAHIHLIPINHIEDTSFTKPRLNISNEELAEIAAKIRGEYGK
ncbi:MAG: HIT family protein [Bacteroidetes bacterium]|nr:HIT family protein [Bacteroidota bacterium]